jgi:hypothetical protein
MLALVVATPPLDILSREARAGSGLQTQGLAFPLP